MEPLNHIREHTSDDVRCLFVYNETNNKSAALHKIANDARTIPLGAHVFVCIFMMAHIFRHIFKNKPLSPKMFALTRWIPNTKTRRLYSEAARYSCVENATREQMRKYAKRLFIRRLYPRCALFSVCLTWKWTTLATQNDGTEMAKYNKRNSDLSSRTQIVIDSQQPSRIRLSI